MTAGYPTYAHIPTEEDRHARAWREDREAVAAHTRQDELRSVELDNRNEREKRAAWRDLVRWHAEQYPHKAAEIVRSYREAHSESVRNG